MVSERESVERLYQISLALRVPPVRGRYNAPQHSFADYASLFLSLRNSLSHTPPARLPPWLTESGFSHRKIMTLLVQFGCWRRTPAAFAFQLDWYPVPSVVRPFPSFSFHLSWVYLNLLTFCLFLVVLIQEGSGLCVAKYHIKFTITRSFCTSTVIVLSHISNLFDHCLKIRLLWWTDNVSRRWTGMTRRRLETPW